MTTTGCSKTTTVTVNATPSAISGGPNVCTGAASAIPLSDQVSGGVWTSGTTTVATISAGGVVTGVAPTTSLITYSVQACPAVTMTVSVTTTPGAISGGATVCQNASITLSDAFAGGVWTSSNTNIATVTGVGGVATVTGGGSTGPINIIYSNGNCSVTHAVTVTAAPPAITGIKSVCTGSTTQLSENPGGGAWSSSVTTVATIGAGSGLVRGTTAGTTVITYRNAGGCQTTASVTVNQPPGPISGIMNVCQTQVTTLSDNNPPGGTWTSGTTTIATVDINTGDVYGVNPGNDVITYHEPVNACTVTTTVTVNTPPSPITGTNTVCQAATTRLSDTSPGGVWSSDNTIIATVGGTGIVGGVSGGTANITYAFTATCYATTVVTVNPLPDTGIISGPIRVCLGSTTMLTDPSPGGVWSTSNTTIATISNIGMVSGVVIGSFNVSYTVTNGCGTLSAVYPMTVDLLVPTVSITAIPGLNICAGSIDTFSATSVNGGTPPVYQWTVNGVVSSASDTLIYTPLNNDVVICKVTSNAGCLSTIFGYDTVTVVVNPTLVPSVSIASDIYGDTVCVATATQFTATPANGGSTPAYVWYVNGAPGTGSNTTDPYVYTPSNGDVVTCQLTSSYICPVPATVVSNSVTMTVDLTEVPAVTITASANPSCEGSPVTYTAHTLYAGIAPFIRWTQNNINVATGPTYTTIPNNGDQFYCILKSSQTCRTLDSVYSTPDPLFQTVDTAIAPVVNVMATKTLLTTGQRDTLIAVVTPIGLTPTYQWYLNGVAIPGATSGSYIITAPTAGISYYYCIVGNGNACNTTTQSGFLVITVYNVGVNQVVNGDLDLQLVPNPNSGTFTVEGTVSSDDRDVTLEINNMVGQVVYKGTARVQNEKLSQQIHMGNDLANGVYLLNVITNNTHKVIRFSLNR
jgi:uncharacterized protein YjdB